MARHCLIVILLVVATAAVFSEVGRMEFVCWDDHRNVFENPLLTPVTLVKALHFWKAPYFSSYIPVTRTVWAALAYLARVPPEQSKMLPEMGISLSPSHFHLANLAVHCLNVLLVFAILRMLTGADWPAAAGAGLFALHPVQVEPVAWVTGMKDLLGGLFALLALWQYLTYAAKTRDAPRDRWRRLHYALAIVAFALSVLSKHTALVLPVMAWALDRWMLGRSARQCTRALAAWLPIAAGAAVVARLTQPAIPAGSPIWARFFVAGDALAFYLSKLALPLRLGLDYARTPEAVLGHTWGYLTWLVPCALALLIWMKRRSWRPLLPSACVFIAGLLPVLGLVPFAFQHYSTVADRYLYLAMLGPSLALAWALSRTDSKLVAAICPIGLVTLGSLSAFQALHWHSSVTLFTHALEINPDSAPLHNALGTALIVRSKPRQGYMHYQMALKIDPKLAAAHYNTGMYLFNSGQPESAIEHYRQALRLAPDADTHFNLAGALSALERYDEAASHYRAALRLGPARWHPHNNLALVLQLQGKYAEAEAHFQEAIRLWPDYAEAYHNLGKLYQEMGRPQQAREAFAQAERLYSERDRPR